MMHQNSVVVSPFPSILKWLAFGNQVQVIPFPFNSLQVEPEKYRPKHVKENPSQVFLEFDESVFFWAMSWCHSCGGILGAYKMAPY